MTFIPATKDNAQSTLDSGINASITSIALTAGNGALFPQPLSGDCSSLGSSTALNDTGALGSVAVGDLIHNVTDDSWAFVTSISGAPNSITTTRLLGGSDNTWAASDVWRINEFIVTFDDGDANGENVTTREKALCTGRSTDTLTVSRGYDSTVASSFSAGDYARLQVESLVPRNLVTALGDLRVQVNTNETFIADLGSTSNGKGASKIAVEDSAGQFTGTNVETVLAEIQDNVDDVVADVALITDETFMKPVFSSVTASTTLTNPTSSTAYDTHTYTIPANDLVPGVWYEVEFIATVTHGTAGTFTMGLGLGAAADVTVLFPSASGTEEIKLKGLIIATAAAGASAAVRYYIEGRTDDSATSVSPSNGLTANEATNGTLTITFFATYGTSNGSNETIGRFSSIKKYSTTQFAA